LENLILEYNSLVEEYNAIYEVYSADINTLDSIISSHNTCSGLVFGKESLDVMEAINE
jgi:hypothetical protein